MAKELVSQARYRLTLGLFATLCAADRKSGDNRKPLAKVQTDAFDPSRHGGLLPKPLADVVASSLASHVSQACGQPKKSFKPASGLYNKNKHCATLRRSATSSSLKNPISAVRRV